MTAPRLHDEPFTARESAPPMSAIEPGQRLKVTYYTDDDTTRTVGGTVSYAGYGKFRDIIKFTPDHTDNTWKLECYKTGSAVFYQHGDAPHDYRRLDVGHRDAEAELEL